MANTVNGEKHFVFKDDTSAGQKVLARWTVDGGDDEYHLALSFPLKTVSESELSDVPLDTELPIEQSGNLVAFVEFIVPQEVHDRRVRQYCKEADILRHDKAKPVIEKLEEQFADKDSVEIVAGSVVLACSRKMEYKVATVYVVNRSGKDGIRNVGVIFVDPGHVYPGNATALIVSRDQVELLTSGRPYHRNGKHDFFPVLSKSAAKQKQAEIERKRKAAGEADALLTQDGHPPKRKKLKHTGAQIDTATEQKEPEIHYAFVRDMGALHNVLQDLLFDSANIENFKAKWPESDEEAAERIGECVDDCDRIKKEGDEDIAAELDHTLHANTNINRKMKCHTWLRERRDFGCMLLQYRKIINKLLGMCEETYGESPIWEALLMPEIGIVEEYSGKEDVAAFICPNPFEDKLYAECVLEPDGILGFQRIAKK